VDPGVQIVEETAGDGSVVERGEMVRCDLQISLNRGEVVHPRQQTTVRVGDRNVFPGLSKSLEGMRRGGYRKTRVSPHLAYGAPGITGKIPPDAVLICEIWLQSSGTLA
jgi:FKBP-type peptidyl-prolyl cis-trans isomerase